MVEKMKEMWKMLNMMKLVGLLADVSLDAASQDSFILLQTTSIDLFDSRQHGYSIKEHRPQLNCPHSSATLGSSTSPT